MHRRDFQLRKTYLPEDQKLTDAVSFETDADACVERAAHWSNALWNKAYLGMGDNQEAAMYRAAQQTGIDPGTFWALRYRKPKGILAHIFNRLHAAYEAECGRQEARLRHELEITKALSATPARTALIDEAEALLGEQASGEGAAR